MSVIAGNLQGIRQRIRDAADKAGRPLQAIRLIAVSKTFPADAVAEAIDCGQADFGENYVQEAIAKMDTLQQLHPGARPIWHFIGPIQSNKTRQIAERFDWVHSIDRLKIAQRLSEQRPAGMKPLQACIQVNISGEASKGGVAPEQLAGLAAQVAVLPGLRLRGLMAIPEPAEDFSRQRQPFARLRALALELQSRGLPCTELSMGMSADLEAAIAEGATLVRIGTAIFGKRNHGQDN